MRALHASYCSDPQYRSVFGCCSLIIHLYKFIEHDRVLKLTDQEPALKIIQSLGVPSPYYGLVMQLHIGTSGWIYRDWIGPFYPTNMKASDKLAFYAGQFQTVEINSTFYRVPTASTVRRWHDMAPKGFKYAVKLNRYLTHTKHLLPDKEFDTALGEFFDLLSLLKGRLGVVLVQLPPSMKLDPARITHLHQLVQKFEKQHRMKFPLAIEFRNKSWFTPEIFKLLHKLHIATVIIDSPGRWPATQTITGGMAYIRLHGHTQLYRSSYSDPELADWLAYLKREGEAKGCKQAFIYFNNDYNGVAIENARTMLQLHATTEEAEQALVPKK